MCETRSTRINYRLTPKDYTLGCPSLDLGLLQYYVAEGGKLSELSCLHEVIARQSLQKPTKKLARNLSRSPSKSTNTNTQDRTAQPALQLILVRPLRLGKRPFPNPLLPHLLPEVPVGHGVRLLPEHPRRAAVLRLANVPRVDGEGDVAAAGGAVGEGEWFSPGYYGIVLEVRGVF